MVFAWSLQKDQACLIHGLFITFIIEAGLVGLVGGAVAQSSDIATVPVTSQSDESLLLCKMRTVVIGFNNPSV